MGWDRTPISSVREREAAFRERVPDREAVRRIPWADRPDLGPALERLAAAWRDGRSCPDGLICGDGEIGAAVKRGLPDLGLGRIEVVSPDAHPETRALAMWVYRQDFQGMAECTCACLARQARPGWSAGIHRIKGELVPPAGTGANLF